MRETHWSLPDGRTSEPTREITILGGTAQLRARCSKLAAELPAGMLRGEAKRAAEARPSI